MVIDSAYRTIAVFEMIHQLTNYTRVKYRPRKFRLESSIKPPFYLEALGTSHKHPKPLLLPLRPLLEDRKRVSSNHKMNWSKCIYDQKKLCTNHG
ncbi:hypothetical protein Csa_016681 [Cucumis sativus]|nr:hypothetical protein Csa_016681 [Cucumis sativus]